MAWQLFVKLPSIKFYENPFNCFELLHVYRRMDGAILIGAPQDSESAYNQT
jgi:hypothetical protein